MAFSTMRSFSRHCRSISDYLSRCHFATTKVSGKLLLYLTLVGVIVIIMFILYNSTCVLLYTRIHYYGIYILQRCISMSAIRDAKFHDNIESVVADVSDGSRLLVGGEREGG